MCVAPNILCSGPTGYDHSVLLGLTLLRTRAALNARSPSICPRLHSTTEVVPGFQRPAIMHAYGGAKTGMERVLACRYHGTRLLSIPWHLPPIKEISIHGIALPISWPDIADIDSHYQIGAGRSFASGTYQSITCGTSGLVTLLGGSRNCFSSIGCVGRVKMSMILFCPHHIDKHGRCGKIPKKR